MQPSEFERRRFRGLTDDSLRHGMALSISVAELLEQRGDCAVVEDPISPQRLETRDERYGHRNAAEYIIKEI